jgi:peroxiredoxin
MKKLILALSAFLTCIISIQGQTDSTTFLRTGDRAPLFRCRTIEGNDFDLSKQGGKFVMINFFATWCGPCNRELPALQEKIWDKYRNNPRFALIVIGRQHTEKEVRDFAENHNFLMPFAPDADRKIFSLFASQNIPRNVIIGPDGKILFQNTGYTAEDFKNIENLLDEKLR